MRGLGRLSSDGLGTVLKVTHPSPDPPATVPSRQSRGFKVERMILGLNSEPVGVAFVFKSSFLSEWLSVCFHGLRTVFHVGFYRNSHEVSREFKETHINKSHTFYWLISFPLPDFNVNLCRNIRDYNMNLSKQKPIKCNTIEKTRWICCPSKTQL